MTEEALASGEAADARSTSITTWTRLEPQTRSNDLTPALEARVHDPLWQLALQWRFGEFVGEDAGSPVWAELTVTSAPLDAYATGGQAWALPPGVPLDCLVGAEPAAPAIPADRAESGAELAGLLAEHGASSAALAALVKAAPLGDVDAMAGGIEGASYLALVSGRLPDAEALESQLSSAATTGQVPPALGVPAGDAAALVAAARDWVTWRRDLVRHGDATAPAWVPEHLEHTFTLGIDRGSASPLGMVSGAWNGDRLDWYDVDVDPALTPPRPPAGTPAAGTTTTTRSGMPTPLAYPGMPSSRFFEFEDAAVNLAQVNAAPEDLARLLVVEFACVYGNDWYLWPADLAIGALHTVTTLTVRTTFGETVQVEAVPVRPQGATEADWQLFRPATGPGSAAAYDGLLLLPTLAGPLVGQPVEEVRFLRDEAANLAWGVEAAVEGADGEAFDRHAASAAEGGLPAPTATSAGGTDTDPLRYRFTTEVPYHWYPLAPDRGGSPDFRRLDVARANPDGTPLILDPLGAVLNSFTRVWQEEVPREGTIVVRRDVHARASDGTPWAWRARRKSTGRGEGSSGLRYDDALPESGGAP